MGEVGRVISVHPYSLRLKVPLPLAGGQVLRVREGVLLRDEASGGWGDVAPLPGFSEETLGEVCAVLAGEGVEGARRFASVRFGLACAGVRAGERVEGVKVNFLWVPGMEGLGEVMGRLAGVDRPCVKVKVGADPDVEGLRGLIAGVPGVRLRLDPNRRWSVETACRVLEALPEGAVEYVEEPFGAAEDYGRLWARVPARIGLDESLREEAGVELAGRKEVVALVLKPTLMGDAGDWGGWVEMAAACGKALVWSSCFECGVGLWHLARLARGGAVSGLDTGRVFAEDVVAPRPLPSGGVLGCAGWGVVC